MNKPFMLKEPNPQPPDMRPPAGHRWAWVDVTGRVHEDPTTATNGRWLPVRDPSPPRLSVRPSNVVETDVAKDLRPVAEVTLLRPLRRRRPAGEHLGYVGRWL